MKKLVTIALTVFSSAVLANVENSSEQAIQQKQPMAAIQVFDTSVKPAKLMDGNKLSRTKSRQVCLFIVNSPIQEKNLFAQYLQAPAPMSLTVKHAKVEAEDNKKNFLITFNLMKKDIKNNIPSECWVFTKDDPIGTYKLDVQFNDIVFKGLEFKLLK